MRQHDRAGKGIRAARAGPVAGDSPHWPAPPGFVRGGLTEPARRGHAAGTSTATAARMESLLSRYRGQADRIWGRARSRAHAAGAGRSEEHTSELQSPCNLVCRLLLEKKKKKKKKKQQQHNIK